MNAYRSSFGAAYDPYTDGSSGIIDGDNPVMNRLNMPALLGFDVGHIALAAGAVWFFFLRK